MKIDFDNTPSTRAFERKIWLIHLPIIHYFSLLVFVNIGSDMVLSIVPGFNWLKDIKITKK